MTEKMTYKKKMGGCTIGYKFAKLETQTHFVCESFERGRRRRTNSNENVVRDSLGSKMGW
jgi:hypothetical protein